MGETTKYRLPYPELAEPANVPLDMRQLAEAAEFVFGSIPVSLPAAQTRVLPADRRVVQGTVMAALPGGDQVVMKNGHGTAKLLVRVMLTAWCNVTTGSTAWIAIANKASTPVPTKVFSAGARISAGYREFSCEMDCYLAPNQTCTWVIQGREDGSGVADVKSNGVLSVTAVSYTLDSLPPYEDQTPPAF